MSYQPSKQSNKDLRAGVIPYDIINGEIWILLGKENDKWSPFAGHVEPGEDIKKAACREFLEEIMGLFLEKDVEDYTIEDSKIVVIDRRSITHLYLFNIDYDVRIPYYFESITKFFLKCTGDKKDQWNTPILGTCKAGLFEKEVIAWFSLTEIETMTNQKRKEFFSYRGEKTIEMLMEKFYQQP